MKRFTKILRGWAIAGVAVAGFFVDFPASGHVLPRQPEVGGKRPPARPAQARQPIEGWMGPTRQATVWR